MMIFDETYTLLEGVSLIASSSEYKFVHMNKQKDIKKARDIDPARIPNAKKRLERFCEKHQTLLTQIRLNPFKIHPEFPKLEEDIIKGFSGAVDKNFPEAIEIGELEVIAKRFGLGDYTNKITSEPKPEAPRSRRTSSLKM